MKVQLGSILFVEDNPNDEELTLEALTDYHLANKIDVCRDGAEALDYLFYRGEYEGRDRGNPAVILLDINLPKLDGHEVLKAIRSDDKLSMIPVVLLTSSKEDSDLLKGYKNGANAFVVKPVQFHEFTAAIRELGSFWCVLNEPPPGTGE